MLLQTLTVQITDENGLKALHALEGKHFIRIIENDEFESSALPGESMDISAFRQWIHAAETTPSIDIKEAKAIWAGKRKQLLRITK